MTHRAAATSSPLRDAPYALWLLAVVVLPALGAGLHICGEWSGTIPTPQLPTESLVGPASVPPPPDGVVATIPVGPNPSAPAVEPGTGDLAVSYYAASGLADQEWFGDVAQISTQTDAVVGRVPVGAVPSTPVYDDDNATLYVPNSLSGNLTALSEPSGRDVGTVTLGPPSEIGACGASRSPDVVLSVQIDPASGQAFAPIAPQCYVSTLPNWTNDSFVETVSLSNLSAGVLVPVGVGQVSLGSMGLYAATGTLYVPYTELTTDEGYVDAINVTNDTVAATIPVPPEPESLTFDAAAGELFVSGYATDNLTILNLTANKAVANVTLPYPDAQGTLDPIDQSLYFAPGCSPGGGGAGNLTLLADGSAAYVGSVRLASVCGRPVYDSINDDVFVPGTGTVTVLAGANGAQIGTISVGQGPLPPTVDPATGVMYVSNVFSGTVSVLGQVAPHPGGRLGLPGGVWLEIEGSTIGATMAVGAGLLIYRNFHTKRR